MEDEATLRLDWPARVDRHIAHGTRLDPELAKQAMKPKARHDPANANTKCPILIMLANRDHRTFKARIADAGHGKQQLAGQKGRTRRHDYRQD